MGRWKRWVWPLAVLVTLGSAYYQRATGPSYPVRVSEDWQGAKIRARLTRNHPGAGDQKIEIRGVPNGAEGTLIWRRYPTSDPFTYQEMRREDDRLTGLLPHQPPAGKLEYRIELRGEAATLPLPRTGSVITRFRGDVPPAVLVPHILVMFVAMLLSNRVGLGAAFGQRGLLGMTRWTLGLLIVGGLVFGPIVQKLAFGSYWTGVPFGWDLTDNKTLISVIVWTVALWAQAKGRESRTWPIVAAMITLIVFMIPHSLLGSELKYE